MTLYEGERGKGFCCCILLQENVSQDIIVLPGLEPTVSGMQAGIATDEDVRAS
jgi:hypothetical protein